MILQEDQPIDLVYELLLKKIQFFFKNCNCQRAVIGLSGGIDSAVVYALLVRALGVENVRGILMPSQFSSLHSVSDAVDLVNNANGKYELVPIEKIYGTFMSEIEPRFALGEWSVAQENLQARIRGAILMSYSNRYNALLVNTSNKSELFMGYGTLYGDLCGAFMAIGDLYKLQVYELARYINAEDELIPLSSISKAPSAELRPGQKDSDSLPPYDVLDPVLHALNEEGKSAEALIAAGADAELVNRIEKLRKASSFKVMQIPPILSVGQKPIAPDFKCF